jgi:hypothetical protein
MWPTAASDSGYEPWRPRLMSLTSLVPAVVLSDSPELSPFRLMVAR